MADTKISAMTEATTFGAGDVIPAVQGGNNVRVPGSILLAYIVDALGTTLDAKLEDIAGLITSGAGISITGNGTDADPYIIASTVTGGGNAVQATVDFGTDSSLVTQTVAAPWVTPTTRLVVTPAAEATTEHDPEDYALEGIQAYATNIVDGVGFDIIARAPNSTFGTYKINIIGV